MRRTEQLVRRSAAVLAVLALGATTAACESDGPPASAQAAAVAVAPLKYAALGDSYASGEGAPPYDSGPTSCKRSDRSWAKRLDADSAGIASVDHRACSGAKTVNLTAAWADRGFAAQIPSPPDPSITLVTVVVGGNDVGFGDIVAACVIWLCPSPTDRGFTGRLTTLKSTLQAQLYPALKAAYPNARIAHVGYPRITPPSSVRPRSCLWLSSSDQKSATGIVDKLNSTIQSATQGKGITYVDVGAALAGHEMCTAAPWVRGIGDDGQAHPTADGQRAIEKVVATALGIPIPA